MPSMFVLKIRSEPSFSGSAIDIFGHEQVIFGAGEAVLATIDVVLVKGNVEGRVDVGDDVFVTIGSEVLVNVGVDNVGRVETDAGGAAATAGWITIGDLPSSLINFVFVAPQTPQLSSTLAVIEYVPGPTPVRSHATAEPEPVMRPAETM